MKRYAVRQHPDIISCLGARAGAPEPLPARAAQRALLLATVAFTLSFAVWGSLAPLAQTLQTAMQMTEQQAWTLIATPVLLGSLLRLPMGMLTDRYGGRLVFGLLLLFLALPVFLLSLARSCYGLLLGALLLGLAGTSFAVGVAFTSRWFPPAQQGLALGLYGVGNIGQSLALLGMPLLSHALGQWQAAYRLIALVVLLAGVLFLLCAKDAPVRRPPQAFGAMLRVVKTQPLAWLFALFYGVTFGGFVALAIGLPKLLQELFHLTLADAGQRAAGFVVLATLTRPLGGWLSDRIGGARVLLLVFAGTALLALGMTCAQIVPFTLGALGVAACIGLGNGAVFKLVPQYFPTDTGTVTGLVSALGGLGGFFPPLALGLIRAQTGSYALGFVLLSATCLLCLALLYRVFLKPPPSPLRVTRRRDTSRAMRG